MSVLGLMVRRLLAQHGVDVALQRVTHTQAGRGQSPATPAPAGTARLLVVQPGSRVAERIITTTAGVQATSRGWRGLVASGVDLKGEQRDYHTFTPPVHGPFKVIEVRRIDPRRADLGTLLTLERTTG